jgi:hypothetical protein
VARTAEGKVKDRVRALLLKHEVHYFMPVQNGYGAAALDYIICSKGRYAQIETKAGLGGMTPRQATVALQVHEAGGKAFLINESEMLFAELVLWLALD